jgi:hypothetical protein
MGSYSPLKITGFQTGLVQQRENFLLPDDAYPVLQNAYVWRERLKRKRGCQLLGRLQRNLTALSEPSPDGTSTYSADLLSSFRTTQPNAQLVPGTLQFYFDFGLGNQTLYEDDVSGNITRVSGPFAISSGSVNYSTGILTLNFTSIPGVLIPSQANLSYYPGLPVMGIRTEELQDTSIERTIFFDQVYAYIYDSTAGAFKEFIPGTTWNAHAAPVSGVDFFWSTNYWVSQLTVPGTATPLFTTTNRKLFWVTNNTGQFGANADPVRITDGTTWVDFFPSIWSQIDATNFLTNWLCMLPYRGRMVTFNTWEGTSAATSVHYRQRIRWSTIGNPFIPYSNGPPATGSWRSDIRGQGGFLDIPTAEDIVSIGFVRDNLVVYCERSTWQLRYTGRSIAPFQIERVNSELGTESTFSAIQFDTSLVGIGDKGIVECDSYKSERIDIKIPDFVFQLNTKNNGLTRVQGVRDFINRLSFWTIPLTSQYPAVVASSSWIFPNQRLVYNYENDSWALFNDSFTALGTYQELGSRTWLNTKRPWIECDFPWINQPEGDPVIVGGNQQGFIENLDELTVNDVSLSISNITANSPNATVITSYNHNMQNEFVIKISGIPTGTPFDNLNGQVFGIVLGDNAGLDAANKFQIFKYNVSTMQFSDPQLDVAGDPFVGYGLISIRDNFSIQSKKFNFLDEGKSIQMGFLDILMEATGRSNPGAISLNVYLDYNDTEASNTVPQNEINDGTNSTPDTFFNNTIPTAPSSLSSIGGTKFWHRVFCPTQANFLTLEYTFSNAQMAGQEQEQDVQIDAQVLWIRRGGKMAQI